MPTPVLIVSSNGELVLADVAGAAHESPLPRLAANAVWPTWRPGTRDFAVSEMFPGGESRLVVLDADGVEPPRVVHTASAGEAIAPRVPQYALWSPDGRRLACVTRSGDALGLFIYDAFSGSKSEALVQGAPIFSAWSADSRYVLCHAGLSLHAVDAVRGEVLRVISEEAAGFRVAALDVDGSAVFAVAESGALRLLESRIESGPAAQLGTFGGGVAMAFQPGGPALAVGVTRAPQTGTFDELWLVHRSTGERTLISRGPYVAYWWSPDGQRLALMVPAQTGDGRHYIRLITTSGEQVAATEAVVPSQDFRLAAGFFDQYAQSHPVWTPDGGQFLIAGRRVDDAVHATLGDPVGDMVFSWKAARGAPLEIVRPGLGAYPMTDVR